MQEPGTNCVKYHVSEQTFTGWSKQQYRDGIKSDNKFVKADSYCQRLGMKRATIRNEAEHKMLDQMLGQIRQKKEGYKVQNTLRRFGFWLGGRRKMGIRERDGFSPNQNHLRVGATYLLRILLVSIFM